MMNPEKFDDTSKRIINGPRPSPLKIKKESHVIRKPTAQFMAQSKPKQQHGPVIIYTESPKIIHTEAQHFMALVQKLTGLTRSPHGAHQSDKRFPGHTLTYDRETVSSDVNDGSFSVELMDKKKPSSSSSPVYKLSNPYLADFPLFTPNSTNLFSSPNANMGASMSLSFLDLLKRFPEN